MARKSKTPLAVSKNGHILFVRLEAVMNPLVAMIDGLRITRFGKEKQWYMRVTDAIRWQRKELADSHGRSGSAEILQALIEVLRKFRKGEVVEA